MNELQGVEAAAIRAFREFCFRWTCPTCGRANRYSELTSGLICECCECHRVVKIMEIEYDNGAVVRAL